MSEPAPLKYTTDIPSQDGLYWEKYERFNGVYSRPWVNYRFKDEGVAAGYHGHGIWSFAGPLKVPKKSEFVRGIPVKPGSYLELIDREDGIKEFMPFIVLPEGSKYKEMTYYGPFPEPEE